MNPNQQQQKPGRTKFPEGTYAAVINDAWATKSGEKGTPGICLEFMIKEHNRRVTWTGWLTDLTKERTLQTLLNCGFIGNKLSDITYGKKAFAEGKELEVVCEYESYTDNATGQIKEFLKVNWVNVPGAFKSKLEQAETVTLFAGMQIEGDFLRLKSEMGGSFNKGPAGNAELGAANNLNNVQQPVNTQSQQTTFNADDIPF